MDKKIYDNILDLANEKNNFTRENGMFLTELEDDFSRVEMEITDRCKNLYGCIHGGALATLMDFAAGALARTDGRRYVTSSLDVKFIANAAEGKVYAIAETVSRGRKLSNLLVKAYLAGEDKLLAEGIATYYCVQ